MSNEEFINKIAPIIQNENSSRGNPLYNSVVIAMGILESGWGKSNLMMKANAIFGIKATSSWKGKVYNSKTNECYDGVNMTEVSASFRAYDSLEEGIKDFFDLICGSSRYKKALNTDSPETCITEIKNGGYATDPDYVSKIMSIINSNNLTTYDGTQSNNQEESNIDSIDQNLVYVVKKGDTLTAIAKKYRIHWYTLYQNNKDVIGGDPNLIKPGQKLRIFAGTNPDTAESYTVKSGDTLTSIAKKYGLTWRVIYDNNKDIIGNNPNLIKPGQLLKIR